MIAKSTIDPCLDSEVVTLLEMDVKAIDNSGSS
jgi:hypothetical protein